MEPVILGLFQHELIRTSKCQNCGSSSNVQDFGYALQIRFEGDTTLTQILEDTTFGGNLIPGRRCDDCSTTADTVQTVCLETSPDVLVLQLVRFNADGSKNMARISFREHLNLTQFTTDREHPVHYRLVSVVHHQGAIDGGHYICAAKGPTGAWNEINDKQVRRNVRIGAALKPKDDFTPYLLFYVRDLSPMARQLR